MAAHYAITLALAVILCLEYSFLRRVRKSPKALRRTLRLGVIFFAAWYVLLRLFFKS